MRPGKVLPFPTACSLQAHSVFSKCAFPHLSPPLVLSRVWLPRAGDASTGNPFKPSLSASHHFLLNMGRAAGGAQSFAVAISTASDIQHCPLCVRIFSFCVMLDNISFAWTDACMHACFASAGHILPKKQKEAY
jgi:hypothetical protein